MGLGHSRPSDHALNCKSISNDYELVIRVSKQLEQLLETQFGATGRGLHEKVSTARVRMCGPFVSARGPPLPLSTAVATVSTLTALVLAALGGEGPPRVLWPRRTCRPHWSASCGTSPPSGIRCGGGREGALVRQGCGVPVADSGCELSLSPPLQLVHEQEFVAIDRAAFVGAYEQAVAELTRLSAAPPAASSSGCIVM